MGSRSRCCISSAGLLAMICLLLMIAPGAAARPAQPQAVQEEPDPPAIAAEGPLYRYEGQLQDSSGRPLTGTVDLILRLYRQETGGTPFWTEAYTGADGISVVGGTFSVQLGSRVPLDAAALAEGAYLEVEVNGEVLSPRQWFRASVPAPEGSPEANCACDNLTVYGSTDLTDGEIKQVNRIKGDQEYIDFLTASHAARGIRVGRLGVDSVYADADGKLDAMGGSSLWVKDRVQSGGDVTVGGRAVINGSGQSILNNPQDVTSSGAGALRFGSGGIWLAMDNNEIAVYGGVLYLQASGATHRVEIGTSLVVDGEAEINGTLDMTGYSIVNCGALVEANLQTAEERAAGAVARFQEGDLLCWGIDRLERCSVAGDRLVQAVADAQGRPIVLGAELVKVLGPVRRGDILVSSPVPGYAMVDNNPVPGSAIAQALVDFDGERGSIKAMIRKF